MAQVFYPMQAGGLSGEALAHVESISELKYMSVIIHGILMQTGHG